MILMADGSPYVAPKPKPKRQELSYDSAQTTPRNANHWAAADSLSPDAALDPYTRRTILQRARYERANNSYAAGIVRSLATYLIGDGPKLQFQSPSRAVNSWVEREFTRWMDATGYADKLRTRRMAKAVDGESFAVYVGNLNLPHPVKLDIRPLECDYFSTPLELAGRAFSDPRYADGIEYDDIGNPVAYWMADRHPGDYFGMPKYSRVPASRIIHWYDCQRPDQSRGVSELGPALPLFAQLRRYTLATIDAAETAANIAAVLKTTAPPETIETTGDLPQVRLTRNAVVPLPDGYDLTQLRAEQPTTQYPAFVQQILCEIARCLGIPRNLASGDSSAYNYSSTRADGQNWQRELLVQHEHLERIDCDRTLSLWLSEARLIPGYMPALLAEMLEDGTPDHRWLWPGTEHQDPAKEASAQSTRLANLTTTLAAEYGRLGLDWESEVRQISRERQLLAQLGLSLPATAGAALPAPAEPAAVDEVEDEVESR